MKKPGKRMRTLRVVFKTKERALAAQVAKVINEVMGGRPVLLKPGQGEQGWTQDVGPPPWGQNWAQIDPPDGGWNRGIDLPSGGAVSNPAVRAMRRKNVKKALSAAKKRRS
ncbi:hypothetical protein [Bradyrhizobium uaiense]|uniref:Uncharacterized protein n=1 Tax=Bradyrhizobium uaiense TaxID=2594946 RepID=A0A6P1BE07_9BRAD|nr:hypothetical protein [Bradyrhizobium uaiense]NEU96404.1 hypothetical protein [Bradyrhizobium uaiense]